MKILTNFAMLSIKILTNAIYAHVTHNELSLRHSIGRTYRRYREYTLCPIKQMPIYKLSPVG